MTLRLSDDQLARLRLECLKMIRKAIVQQRAALTDKQMKDAAEGVLAWCLRDRPVEPEET